MILVSRGMLDFLDAVFALPACEVGILPVSDQTV